MGTRVMNDAMQKYFFKKYLNEENTSKKFFNSISYNVDLQKLFRIHKHVNYDKAFKICTVLLEIIPQRIRDYYNGRYLLQVYDDKGYIRYEKALKYDIVSWNMGREYIVFKVDSKEEGSQWINLVKFRDEYSYDDYTLYKVKDVAPDSSYIHLGLSQGILHYANSNTIRFIDTNKEPTPGTKEVEIVPADDEVGSYSINAPNVLHGFFENSFSYKDTYIMCAIEVEDNQIDYTRLYNWVKDAKNPELGFYQYREVVGREVRGDKIVKHCFIIDSDSYAYGLALRASGKVDFYWNFTLISSQDEYFDDIQINFDNMYLKSLNQSLVYQIAIKWKERVGVQVAEKKPFGQEGWEAIIEKNLRNHVKIYQSMTLIKTQFVICYGKIVATYDLVKKEWTNQFIFEDNVLKLYRYSAGDSKMSIGVYLQNGKIKILDSKESEPQGNYNQIPPTIWYIVEDKEFTLEGTFVNSVSDWRDLISHYILTIDNNKKKRIYCLQEANLSELTSQVGELDEYDSMIKVITGDPTEDFVIYNSIRKEVKIFQITSDRHEKDVKIEQKHKFILTSDEYYFTLDSIHTIIRNRADSHFVLINNSEAQIVKIEQEYEGSSSLKNEQKIISKKSINISQCQMIDQMYLYILKEQEPQSAPGLYLLEIDALVEREAPAQHVLVKNSTVGQNNLIDYYSEEERIGFMHSFRKITIVPLIHRNVINFIGMKALKNYYTFLRKYDKFYALEKNNVLTVWSIVTGKIVSQNRIKNEIATQDYEIFTKTACDMTYFSDWYAPKILLFDQVNEVSEFDAAKFYGDRYKTSLTNNEIYSKIEVVKFRNFKLIELVSETEVKEHFRFVHPVLDGDNKYQRIYFSDDSNLMLERLDNQRVFLFKRKDTFTPGLVEWELVRRIRPFPLDLSEITYNNFLFSPNFLYYLDYNREKRSFLIRKSIDQSMHVDLEQLIKLPKNDDKERTQFASCFKWIDNQKIKIISADGIEKIVDVADNFEVLSQGTITEDPDDTLAVDGEGRITEHFFFKNKSNGLNDVRQRLNKKNCNYFTAYYLDKKRDPTDLYSVLFGVDYCLSNDKDEYLQKKPVIDLSFTYIDWRIAETIRDPNQKFYKINGMSDDKIKVLLMNIFPQGKSVLHYSYKNIKVIKKMFQRVKTMNDNLSVENKKKFLFNIPFQQDFKGESPLHGCIRTKNFKSAAIILDALQDTPLDSHSRAIYDLLPLLMENDINVGTYLDKRFLQTEAIEKFKRGAILYRDSLPYALGTSELWADVKQVEKQVLVTSPFDAVIKIEMLDMPNIHSYCDPTSDEFFKALAEYSDIGIFSCTSIRALIDYKYPLCREYTIKILFAPFIIYLLLFIVYSNRFSGSYYEDTIQFQRTQYALWALLYIFSAYFLFNELRQIMNTGVDYLKSFWNYSDLLPPIFICVVISIHINEIYNREYVHSDFVYTVHALASLLLWAKLIYFLRIFRHTGYFVRILSDVVFEMRIFIFFLCIVYLGFGEAFLRFSESSIEDAAFLKSYADAFVFSFRLSMGDNNTDGFDDTVQPVALWIIWVLAAILTNIIMLNLLVAVISEAFAKILDTKDNANYQERARLIAENSYLIPIGVKRKLEDTGKNLIIATEVVDEDEPDQVKSQIQCIHDEITAIKKEMVEKSSLKSIEEKLDKLLAPK